MSSDTFCTNVWDGTTLDQVVVYPAGTLVGTTSSGSCFGSTQSCLSGVSVVQNSILPELNACALFTATDGPATGCAYAGHYEVDTTQGSLSLGQTAVSSTSLPSNMFATDALWFPGGSGTCSNSEVSAFNTVIADIPMTGNVSGYASWTIRNTGGITTGWLMVFTAPAVARHLW